MKKLSKQSFPSLRMRRLRSTDNMRRLVRETKLVPENLIQPIFLSDGKNKKEKISSMPDIFRLSIDHALKEIKILQLDIDSKYRFVLKREFFSPAMIFGSILGYKFLATTALVLFTFGLYHQVSDYIALREKSDITY